MVAFIRIVKISIRVMIRKLSMKVNLASHDIDSVSRHLGRERGQAAREFLL